MMQRRRFLQLMGSLPLTTALADAGSPLRAAEGLDTLFQSDDPALRDLALRVMGKCVLANLRSPEPPLKRTWMAPGGPHYIGQWIWDTMFMVDLLALLPGTEKQIRDIFANYADFQQSWNAREPQHAQDMITVAIKTHPQEERRFSQIPILAWGLERVFLRNGDRTLLEENLGWIEKFHEWYWRERDLHGNGLVAWAPTAEMSSTRAGKPSTTSATWMGSS